MYMKPCHVYVGTIRGVSPCDRYIYIYYLMAVYAILNVKMMDITVTLKVLPMDIISVKTLSLFVFIIQSLRIFEVAILRIM